MTRSTHHAPTRGRPTLAATLCTLILASIALAQPEHHAVASRRAIVRADHDTAATALESLDRGDTRMCFTDPNTGQPLQRQRFYRIRTADNRTGWVSRYVVRIRTGPPPSPIETGEPPTQPAEPAHPPSQPGRSDDDDSTSRHTHEALAAFRVEHQGVISYPKSEIVLVNEGYVVGYDPRLKTAAWVQFRLTKDDYATGERVESFRADPRLEAHQSATLDDYKKAPILALWDAIGDPDNQNFYARGHIIPDASQKRDDDLQSDTYVLSNMAPHVQNGFNSGTWSSLEENIRGWCDDRNELYVIVGPIFRSSPRQIDPHTTEAQRVAVLDDLDNTPTVRAQPPTDRQMIYNLLGHSEVAVPSAMFCVVIDARDPDNIDALGFIIDNARRTVGLGRRLVDTLASIDEIEKLTGLDLLAGMNEQPEEALEARTPTALWE